MPDREANGMHRLVEAPRVLGEAEVREDLALDVLLRVDRELTG